MFRNVESTSNSRFVKARPGGTRGETAKSPASPCSATLPAPQIMGFGTVLRASGFFKGFRANFLLFQMFSSGSLKFSQYCKSLILFEPPNAQGAEKGWSQVDFSCTKKIRTGWHARLSLKPDGGVEVYRGPGTAACPPTSSQSPGSPTSGWWATGSDVRNLLTSRVKPKNCLSQSVGCLSYALGRSDK